MGEKHKKIVLTLKQVNWNIWEWQIGDTQILLPQNKGEKTGWG